jgi:outer membrane receptor protein involved in Fe transport
MGARHDRVGFLVPNETLQQDAGQRQDRTSEETSGQVSFAHLFSPSVLLDLRGLGRDVAAALWSNGLSTPIEPFQNRSFREGYGLAAVSVHHGIHDFKFGADVLARSINEQFSYKILAYQIGSAPIFDPDTPASFFFANRRQDRELGAYVQDQIRYHSLTINAGVRWDHYRLMVDEQAVSPRLAVAWQVPGAGLVLRASYDRAFQTPAIENLLLASSASLLALNNAGLILPVRPSRGDFYEAGLAKSLFGHLRLDGSYYRRDLRNFADDDLCSIRESASRLRSPTPRSTDSKPSWRFHSGVGFRALSATPTCWAWVGSRLLVAFSWMTTRSACFKVMSSSR